jgi:hypothetical protein
MHTIRLFATIATAALSLAACGDDFYDNSPDESLELSHESITVGRAEQAVWIGVAARDAGWSMTGSEEWCAVDPTEGGTGVSQIAVTFAAWDAPEGEETRTAHFIFTSAGEQKSITVTQLSTDILPPDTNEDYAANEAIKEELDKWYYNGETRTVAADFNQSYDDFFYNYLANLDRNTFDGNEWAMSGDRYLHSYIERSSERPATPAGPPLNYGMEFDLKEFDGGRLVGRILYVEPGSPAATARLERGNWFNRVSGDGTGEGTVLATGTTAATGFDYYYQRFIDTLVNPIAGISPRLGLLSLRAAGMTLVNEGRSATLTPSNFSGNPILGTQVITSTHIGTGEESRTGYMMYNRFDPAFRDELIARFDREFKEANLDNFILDLRYNKSGTVEMAELMGDLLAGNVPGVAGETFARYEFYGDAAAHNKTVTFKPHPSGIAADTLFVLTSSHTAGASELLINALRGLDQSVVKLVVTGEATQGLAAGMVRRTFEVNDMWYTAWILAFRCRNANGEGDYMYGLAPNGGEVSEWQGENVKWSTVWGWKGQLGSTEDALVRRAMDMIEGREFIPPAGVIDRSRQQRPGFQRKFSFPTNMTMEIE